MWDSFSSLLYFIYFLLCLLSTTFFSSSFFSSLSLSLSSQLRLVILNLLPFVERIYPCCRTQTKMVSLNVSECTAHEVEHKISPKLRVRDYVIFLLNWFGNEAPHSLTFFLTLRCVWFLFTETCYKRGTQLVRENRAWGCVRAQCTRERVAGRFEFELCWLTLKCWNHHPWNIQIKTRLMKISVIIFLSLFLIIKFHSTFSSCSSNSSPSFASLAAESVDWRTSLCCRTAPSGPMDSYEMKKNEDCN